MNLILEVKKLNCKENRASHMKSVLIPFIFLMSLPFLMSCSGRSVESTPDTDPIETPAWLTGVHYLHGPKTTTGVPNQHFHPDYDYLPEIVSFSVNVAIVEGKQDTIRFFGLYGADAGDVVDRVFPDCTVSDDCKVYARVNTPFVDFEIDIENRGRRYQATGVFTPTTLQLTGRYTHGGREIDYELDGERIEFY